LLGYRRDEVMNKTDYDFFPQEQADFFIEKDRQVLASLQVLDIPQESILSRNNGLRVLHTKKLALKDHNGRPKYLLGISEDITERQRSEKERELLFHLSPDMFCIAGFDGYFKELNPIWQSTLGWTRDELLSKPYMDFVHPDDRESTIRAAIGLSQGDQIILFENRYLSKDGSYRWLSWNTCPLVTESLIFATARDVTVQKQMEESARQQRAELETINRELEAFSYSVSHDLRTPLRAIDGFSRLLLEKHESNLDKQGKDYLQRIRMATLRMGDLIDDLLSLSRIARARIKKRPVNLSIMARALLTDLQNTDPCRIVKTMICEQAIDHADPQLLRIVLENLFGNAWKYTRKQPNARIEFGFAEYNGTRSYFVKDNGIGFDMKYSEKLFGAFQRLHSVAEFEGTGIGLATVQRIIHRHGGKIWAEGSPNRGATFYFTLHS
jgi:PAS domain S-box-containing protein